MSPIIEVLIGMIFIYSLLSILVTQINTVISQTLRLRGRYLLGAFNDIIQDVELRAKVITHPLINLVKGTMLLPGQRITTEEAEKIVNGAVTTVEWINPKTFVNVLTSVIRVDSDNELFGALLHVIDGMPSGEDRRRLRLKVNEIIKSGTGVNELIEMVNTLEDFHYRTALQRTLDDIQDEIAELGLETDSNIALMAGLRKIDNPYFREAMETILSTSKTLEEAEEQIVRWFDDAMDRTTNAFKSSMRVISLLVGLGLSVLLNVDSLYISLTLWEDPALRESVNAIVAATDIDRLEATVTTSEEAAASDEETTVEDVASSVLAAQGTLSDLLELRIPLGWSLEDLSTVPEDSSKLGDGRYLWNLLPWNNPDWFGLLFVKILGIAATAIAVAQGAPFWFGILRQLSGGSTA